MYQSVFISGVSGAIGLSLSLELIKRSLVVNLYVQVRQNRNDMYLKELCQKHNVNLYLEHFDIRDDDFLKSFIKKALSHDGKCLIIANAGVSLSCKDGSFLEDDFEIDRAFDVNAKGSIKTLYYATNAFLDKISHSYSLEDTNAYSSRDNDNKSESGFLNKKDDINDFLFKQKKKEKNSLHLVAISSLASLLPMRSSPLYSASKSSVNMYVKALDASLKKRLNGMVKTTLVLPGFVKSHMSDRFVGSKSGMISSDRAASVIVSAIEHEKKICAFPMYLYLGIKLSNLVPDFLLSYIMKAFDFSVIKDQEREKFEKESTQCSKEIGKTLCEPGSVIDSKTSDRKGERS